MQDNTRVGDEQSLLDAISLHKEYEDAKSLFQPKEVAHGKGMQLGDGMNINGDSTASALERGTEIEIPCKFAHDSQQKITTSVYESTEALSAYLKFDFSIHALKASGGFSLLNEMTRKENSVFASFLHLCQDSKSRGMQSDPKFKQGVLEDIQKEGSLKNFYQKYGTHYISQIFNHASFFGLFELTTQSEQSKKEIAANLSVSFSKMNNKGEIDGGIEWQKEVFKKVENMSCRIRTVGITRKQEVSTIEGLITEYNSFLAKVEKNQGELSPCVVVLKPYSSLLDFVNSIDSEKYQQSQKEIEEEYQKNIKAKILKQFKDFLEDKRYEALAYLLKIKDLRQQFEEILKTKEYSSNDKYLMIQFMEAFGVLKDSTLEKIFGHAKIGVTRDLCHIIEIQHIVPIKFEHSLFTFEKSKCKLECTQNGKFYNIIFRNLELGKGRDTMAFAISKEGNHELMIQDLNYYSEDQLFEFIPVKDNKFNIRHKKTDYYLNGTFDQQVFSEFKISREEKSTWYSA